MFMLAPMGVKGTNSGHFWEAWKLRVSEYMAGLYYILQFFLCTSQTIGAPYHMISTCHTSTDIIKYYQYCLYSLKTCPRLFFYLVISFLQLVDSSSCNINFMQFLGTQQEPMGPETNISWRFFSFVIWEVFYQQVNQCVTNNEFCNEYK